jgi:hypothetical protein
LCLRGGAGYRPRYYGNTGRGGRNPKDKSRDQCNRCKGWGHWAGDIECSQQQQQQQQVAAMPITNKTDDLLDQFNQLQG